ncbi:hypothetical protein KGD83_21800 [Nocardiopsis akebiae]|uniref:Uncharacterized protein n=1 Tax=Nocardiopsis akebiae TaxID=2831968 RepID=A0ABX8C0F0_9ACTN|nr:hypothetical protein [Nocardiopsis akebiae]QUX27889.1 hypothetical protein KGD83_21800 [Nocardiopsis akebiae]
MTLLLTLLLIPCALGVVYALLRHLTGGLLPDQNADLAELRAIGARQNGGEHR